MSLRFGAPAVPASDPYSTAGAVPVIEDRLADHVDVPDRASLPRRSSVWRSRQGNGLGNASLPGVDREAPEYVFDTPDLDVTDEEIKRLGPVHSAIAPFEDTRPGMGRLSEAESVPRDPSNGDRALEVSDGHGLADRPGREEGER